MSFQTDMLQLELPIYSEPSIDSDRWDLSFLPAYCDVSKRSYRHRLQIDFTNIRNNGIRNEGKIWLLDCTERGLHMNLIYLYTRTIFAVDSFIGEYGMLNDSILDMKADEFIILLNEWLADHGFQTVCKGKAYLTAAMTIDKKTKPNNIIDAYKTFYNFIFSRHTANMPEYDKDIWDIRNIGINYMTLRSRPAYTLNFSGIRQNWLRASAKKFAFSMLPSRSVQGIQKQIIAVKQFSEFLGDDVASWDDITRTHIKEFIRNIRHKSGSSKTDNGKISCLRSFFDTVNLLEHRNIKTKKLFLRSDLHKEIVTAPEFFSDNEIGQLFDNIQYLPDDVARVLIVISATGGRISDILEMACDSVLTHSQYGWMVHYYQPKTGFINDVPVEDAVAEAIMQAIAASKEAYGENCCYVFAKNADEPLNKDYIMRQLNALCYRNGILDDEGNILHIKSHSFRRTRATYLFSRGVPSDIVRRLLGQRSLSVIDRYINVESADYSETMDKFIEEQDAMLRNIGHMSDISKDFRKQPNSLGLSLPNGICCKPLDTGVCEHANKCYRCVMFKPVKEMLPVYRRQLSDAQRNHYLARSEGLDRTAELFQQEIDAITKIIDLLSAGKEE